MAVKWGASSLRKVSSLELEEIHEDVGITDEAGLHEQMYSVVVVALENESCLSA